jgi:hypothetical protein
MRCSELSLESHEPIAATAPFAERWELIEQPKPWGRDHGLKREGAKVLLVQRVSGFQPQSPGGRTYLVCTNGARDPCCAIRGAAVAKALDAARPGAVYESSHLGGHRFAANVLVLPDGLCFGRLDVRSALALMDELDAGRLPLEHFRGRTSLTEEQQAAEIALRRELGLERLDDVKHVEGTTFALSDGRRATVHVRGEQLEPRPFSCREDKVSTPTAWSLVDIV